jgi:hypothetical protein
MKVVRFGDYQQNNDLSVLDGARWLLITHQELSAAATILFHSELLDILVAVDFRGAKISSGLWQRAVHLILADSSFENDDEAQISKRTGITKVVLDGQGDLQDYCW